MKKFTLLLSAMLMTVMSFAGVVTFGPEDFNGKGTTSVGSPVEVTKDGVTVSCDKGYGNSYAFRCYANGVVTISATENISSLEFAFDTYNDRYYNGGLEEVYTVGASSWSTTLASQARFTSIKVTLGEGGSDTPDNGDDNGGNEGGGTTPPTPPVEGVITCAQAVEICKATGETATTDTYTIRGYVTEIKEAYNTQFGNVSCWMADEKGGGQVFLAFRVKPVNVADQAVKVNDYIEVKGKLVNYYGNTPETTAGGSMTIITAADGGTTPPTPPTPPTNLVGDGTETNPYTVEDVLALNNTSKGPHYVKGFIIGQVNGASIADGLDTEAPFVGSTNSDGSVATQGTNLMIAGVAGDTTKMVAVQLPKGSLRDEFNLVEHPEMLGAEVLICGSLEKYFGVAGIKSPTSITLLSEVGPSNVVNVKDLPYAEAYYYEADNVYEFMLYNIDEAAEELLYPVVIMGVNAKSKTAINGTYEVLSAMYATGVNANDEFEGVMSDGVGTLTIKNVDSEGNYSFVGSFVGEDGKTYKLNTVANVYAMDGDTKEEIELKEETETPPTPPTPPVDGAIVFDADVDKGNAGTDSNNATAYQITKNGVTVEVTSGILGVYNNENHYRIYKNQTLTVTSTVGNIAKVEFTCTANDAEKYGPGCFTVDGEYTYSGAVGTWTGDAASVTFAASANQVRATQIVVTLAGTTDVENVVVGQTPTKIIENGQVLIIRGENIYNILGTQVK